MSSARIGEFLVRSSIINQQQFDTVLASPDFNEKFIGTLIVEKEFVSEEEFINALSEQYAVEIANLEVKDIDLWEINEAFSPVVLATIKELKLDPELVNVNGGAIALGHPLGATGAIIVGTALDELERREQRYAHITMCIGLGMGVATIIERIN